MFVSRKIEQELNVKETKPPIVNQQYVVYGFQCDLCDAGDVGYTRGHLHNRVKGHTINEMQNYNLDLLCVSECRWTRSGRNVTRYGSIILFSGKDNVYSNGVALIADTRPDL